LRVVYFSQDFGPHDHRFLQALSRAGQEVHFVRLEPGREARQDRTLPEGVRVAEGWAADRRIRWWQLPGAARRLRGVLQQLQPDVVHAGPVQGPGLVSALAGSHPLLTMSWGSDLLWRARFGPGRWAARYVLARSDALACDCQAVRQQAVSLGMPDERVVVFPWGVDLEHFSPGPSRLRAELGWERASVVLSARSWERLLGVDLLVDSFLRAAAARPQLRLLMLGTGSLDRKVREHIRRAGLDERVHFAGPVVFDRLPDYYRCADLYLSASHSDGSSISLLEAMACGLPALVSDIPGNREWVEPEANGRWFADGEVMGLTQSLMDFADRPGEWLRYGARGREIAEARADWSRNFPRLLEGYELARRQAGRRM
jgi:glycosyltransferase involved in cell wall biosynthesis